MTAENIKTGYPSVDKPWLKYYSEESIHAKLPECKIYELLWKNNKNHLADTALNYYDRKIAYGELFENIEKTTKAFAALGVKEGETVAICSVNTPETVYAFYALNRLGAIANMIDPRTNADGVQHYLEECHIRYVVTIEVAYPLFKKVNSSYPIAKIISVSPADSLPQPKKFLYRLKNKPAVLEENGISWSDFISLGEKNEYQDVVYKENTCCVIAHTGGTTGSPKGVMISNDNLNAVAHAYQHINISLERQQRFFNDLPPFIMYGLGVAMHAALCRGLEVILYPVFDSENFPKLFKKYKPHHFCGLPDHLKHLISHSATEKMDMSFLITPCVGGDGLNTELEEQVNQFLAAHNCTAKAIKGYGMTELSAPAISTDTKVNAIGSIGIPLIMNTVKIVDMSSLKELPCGESGEIWISGPTVMMGYYNMPKETEETIAVDENGTRWIRTGDLGYMTSEGLVYHQGRIRRIYLTSYEGQPAKIFPMLVEEKIKQSENVFDCVVVGRLKENSANYEAVAFVIKKDKQLDIAEEVKNICSNEVPTYMQPVEYRFVEEFPHTPIGKVDFRTLEKEAEKL